MPFLRRFEGVVSSQRTGFQFSEKQLSVVSGYGKGRIRTRRLLIFAVMVIGPCEPVKGVVGVGIGGVVSAVVEDFADDIADAGSCFSWHNRGIIEEILAYVNPKSTLSPFLPPAKNKDVN